MTRIVITLIIHSILAIMSIPFAIIGFIFEFILQSVFDGMLIHRKFYKWVTKDE